MESKSQIMKLMILILSSFVKRQLCQIRTAHFTSRNLNVSALLETPTDENFEATNANDEIQCAVKSMAEKFGAYCYQEQQQKCLSLMWGIATKYKAEEGEEDWQCKGECRGGI